MRALQCLQDTALLDKDPLASQFLARTIATSDTRSRSGGFNASVWVQGLVEMLKGDANWLRVVQTWLVSAFSACPQDTPQIQAQSEEITANDVDIGVFVQFYWELYKHSDESGTDSSAMRLLNKERSRRGYYYELRDHGGEPAPAEQFQVPPDNTIRFSDGVLPRIDDPGAVQVEQDDTQVAAEHMSLTDPKANDMEVTPSVTLGSKRKAESDVPMSPTQPVSSIDVPHSVTPQPVLDTIMHEDRAMSPVSELSESDFDAQHATDMEPAADVPDFNTPINRSGRPSRRASNVQRLTVLAQDLSVYEEQRSRGMFGPGREPDSRDSGTFMPVQLARRGKHCPQMAHRTSPRPKKPRRGKKKSDKSNVPAKIPVAADEASPKPLSGVLPWLPSDPACNPASTSPTTTSKKTAAKKPRQRTAKKPRISDDGSLLTRPSKRSRSEDSLGVVDAQVGFIEGSRVGEPEPRVTLTANFRARASSITEPTPPAGAGSQHTQLIATGNSALTSSSSSSVARDQERSPRKRKRAVPENTRADVSEDRAIEKPNAIRATKPLPRGHKAPAVVCPKPAPSKSSRQQNCLADVDAVVQGAALSACLETVTQTSNASPHLPNWVATPGLHREDDPSDFSDDEIPLSVLAAARPGGSRVAVASTAEETTARSSDIHSPGSWPHLPERTHSTVSPPPLQAEPYVPPAGSIPTDPKPRLHVTPPIWAESRQEVCETFEWFRSYQGGVYFLKDMVKGYLLGGFAASRDLFAQDGRVIISHGGGKAESIHTQKGVHKTHEATDQLEGDKSVRALLNTHTMQRPLALLVDDKYTLFPFDLAADGYTYVVLGFYRIAHAWAEEQPAQNASGSVVRYKFAFQWCEEQGKPWWLAPRSVPHGPCTRPDAMEEATSDSTSRHPARDISSLLNTCEPSSESQPDMVSVQPAPAPKPPCPDDGPVLQVCDICKNPSPMVYAEGWMCLHRKCTMFWRSTQGHAPTHLTYAKSFLHLIPFVPEELGDLRPGLPAQEVEDGITTTSMFCKGWHCLRCGRLSSRYRWEHWHCKNCGEEYRVDGRIRDPKEFWTQPGPQHFMSHVVAHDSGIMAHPMRMCELEDKRWGQLHTYVLPDGRGMIHLISPPAVLRAPATKAFMDYQTQAANGELLFRRWPMRAHKCRGTLLTNYFSQNCGEPYQYVGGTDNTVPWDRAPSAVCDALSLIQTRMKLALGIDAHFNEVLSAAYMERQRMAFHSDAERGLGPVVASLSLGSGAYMYFRLLGKYTDKKGQGGDRNALTLYLRHGDVVVMQGAEVQTYYEHTVVPVNFRIAATARSIDSRNQ